MFFLSSGCGRLTAACASVRAPRACRGWGSRPRHFAWCDYAEWVENPASREDWLYYVGRDGLAFLRDVPVEDAAVLRLPRTSVSFARPTTAASSMIADSLPHLPVHTDNPYRDPVPGFQLLHCLSAAGRGRGKHFRGRDGRCRALRAHDA